MDRLQRFHDAQNSSETGFDTALAEIRAGAKRGHWIWYVFPQLAGLGTSPASRTFGIDDAEEAGEYLRDPELRSRLLVITRAVAEQLTRGKPLRQLMGSDIDVRKLVSSLTLFGYVAKQLDGADPGGDYKALGAAADQVLAAAASQGYPRCAYTLDRLRRP